MGGTAIRSLVDCCCMYLYIGCMEEEEDQEGQQMRDEILGLDSEQVLALSLLRFCYEQYIVSN